MIRDFPCKIIDYTTAKPGKHGSAKAAITGIDIFTGKKHEGCYPTGGKIMVPYIDKKEYELACIDEDDFVSFQLEDGSIKDDVKLPNDAELKKELMKYYNDMEENGAQIYFTVLSACGTQKIVSGRAKNWKKLIFIFTPIYSNFNG